MKFFGIALLIISLGVVATAQTSTASNHPTDLQVLKAAWKSETRLAQDAVREEEDSMGALPISRARRRRGGRVSVYDSAARASRNDDDMWPADDSHVDGYLYQVTVRNTGQKEIKAVTWQYNFTDLFDPSIVSRHRFTSKTKIAPGKEKKLDAFALSPPTTVVNAKAAEKNPDQPYIEQVQITRIEYTDGTVWELPIG